MEMRFGFVIALPAYKKKQGDKALKGSGSKLGPILAWALWCFEESVNLITIVG